MAPLCLIVIHFIDEQMARGRGRERGKGGGGVKGEALVKCIGPAVKGDPFVKHKIRLMHPKPSTFMTSTAPSPNNVCVHSGLSYPQFK